MVVTDYATDGYAVFAHDPRVHAWASAAHAAALTVIETPGDLRHGKTWRVGVDELPNANDGSIGDVALRGPWEPYVDLPSQWHRAQLSVVYPGYPQQDATDSDAAHGYRLRRDAAHVDGLLPIGPAKRRYLREPHGFILGLPLNQATASPLVVWPRSHVMMREAFVAAFDGVATADWENVDVTDVYQAARREVFATCERREVPVAPGQAILVHRHLLHGVAPWAAGHAPDEGRMIAYFRPILSDVAAWL